MANDGTREQLFIVHLSIDGTDYGVWDKSSEWIKDTNSVRYRDGGSPNDQSLGGPTTHPDITLGRNFKLSRDYPIMEALLTACGQGDVVAQQQPLNRDYSAYGSPMVANGTLKTVTFPAVDSESSNAAMIQLVFEVNSLSVVAPKGSGTGLAIAVGL